MVRRRGQPLFSGCCFQLCDKKTSNPHAPEKRDSTVSACRRRTIRAQHSSHTPYRGGWASSRLSAAAVARGQALRDIISLSNSLTFLNTSASHSSDVPNDRPRATKSQVTSHHGGSRARAWTTRSLHDSGDSSTTDGLLRETQSTLFYNHSIHVPGIQAEEAYYGGT